MASQKSNLNLHQQNHKRDAELSRAVHGDSHQREGGIASLLGKRTNDNAKVADDYFKHFDGKVATEEERLVRTSPIIAMIFLSM